MSTKLDAIARGLMPAIPIDDMTLALMFSRVAMYDDEHGYEVWLNMWRRHGLTRINVCEWDGVLGVAWGDTPIKYPVHIARIQPMLRAYWERYHQKT